MPRNKPLRVEWQNGDSSRETVLIFGFSSDDNRAGNVVGAALFCQADADAGFFDVPTYVLGVLPPSAIQDGFAIGVLQVGSLSLPQRLDVQGLDFASIGVDILNLKGNVRFE